MVDNFCAEGVESDGRRTVLGVWEHSSEARRWLQGYVAEENAGGWDLIEIYDIRGEPERIVAWEREGTGSEWGGE